MKSGSFYGIDFGTTNTSVYRYSYDSKYGVKEMRFGTDGKDIYPFSSCIAIPKRSGHDFKFGREVRENANTLSENYVIVSSFKSLLGTSQEIAVNNERYTGVKLVALFLAHIVDTIGLPDFTEAIFSIPVGFSAAARKDLTAAAEAVGIYVKGFVSESSAAYISKMENIRAFSKVLVVDWGGGTLDLSVLTLNQSRIYEEAVYGVKFGGDDIDRELALRLMPKIFPSDSFENLEPAKKDRLMRNVEEMKIYFSTEDYEYEMICGPGSKPVDIDYETFEEIVTSLITENVFGAVGKILKMVNARPDGIDAVLLAGGSSGVRPFADAIINTFGIDKIIFDVENNGYQWIVARGAAITSATNCRFVLNDDLCLLMSDDEPYPILRKNENCVGDIIAPLTFSITDDATDAHFIFTDSGSRTKYETMSVNTKGYYNEKLVLTAEIGKDQIARICVTNENIGSDYCKSAEIGQLRFYYDLSEIEE